MGFLRRRGPKSQAAGFADSQNHARPGEPDQLQKVLLAAARSARRESNSEIVGGDETRPQEVEARAERVSARDGDGSQVATEQERRPRLWLNRKRPEVSKGEAAPAEERHQVEAARA